MEISVLPLDLFNDAARLLKGMSAAYCIPPLTGQANHCFDSILGMVAMRVNLDCESVR